MLNEADKNLKFSKISRRSKQELSPEAFLLKDISTLEN
jgi:hypothetical protein